MSFVVHRWLLVVSILSLQEMLYSLIVTTSMRYAATHPSAAIGKDTDLLVLLCHNAQLSSKPIIFRSDKKAGNDH